MPSWLDFLNFLEERCIPRDRAGLREYLETIGVDEYDPIEIIKNVRPHGGRWTVAGNGGAEMTVHLVTNEKIAETSSKGNQEKWYDCQTDRWYKLDQFGYEALSETLISTLLEQSNIEKGLPFRFARYQMERISAHGRDRTGCSSINFLDPGQSIITISHLFSKQLGMPLKKKLEGLTSDKSGLLISPMPQPSLQDWLISRNTLPFCLKWMRCF